MAPKYEQSERLLLDRERLAGLCAVSEGTVRRWLRIGIVVRANQAAPRDQAALFDLDGCLPRILCHLSEKRELTPEERRLSAARLRLVESKAARAELAYREAAGELFSKAEVLAVVGPQHIAMCQKMLGLPNKTARALATMTDPLEIQKLLTAEVRQALAELVGFRQTDIAARRRQRIKGNGAGREVERSYG